MKRLVQFGLPRSGSTRIYNALREALPDFHIEKAHAWEHSYSGSVCVATIRDACSMLVSSWRVQPYRFANEDGSPKYEVLKKRYSYCIDQMDKMSRGAGSVLWLPYFLSKQEVVTRLSVFLDLSDRSMQAAEKWLDTAVSIAIQNKYPDFRDFDPVTHIHGDHIGGQAWAEILPFEFHERLKELAEDLDQRIHAVSGIDPREL